MNDVHPIQSLQAAPAIPRRCRDHGLLFRYDPVLSPEGEFVLWYNYPGLNGAAAELEVRTRWFDDEGRVLIWGTEPATLDLAERGLWRPLLVDAPLQPRNVSRLRFEIIVKDGAGTEAVYSGVLSRDAGMRPPHLKRGVPARAVQERTPPDNPKHERVTAVVTSCCRQDLLERTLDSFFHFNTYPIDRIIVVEDGSADVNAPLVTKYRNRQIEWLSTNSRMGQIVAIDYAYSTIDTEFILHCEDDWEFYASGFVEKSLVLLQALPRCLQVWIQPLNEINGHPLGVERETASGVPYRRFEFGYIAIWHGFSFTPGLRRTADYRLLGRYGRYVRHDNARPGSAEAGLSQIYRNCGFYTVILADNAERGYVRHIGDGRHVS
jgi:hypothetical protein